MQSSPEVIHALRSLAEVPEVAAAVDDSREACTQLRWHQALRRRIPEAAAESRVRGAWASARLEGARTSVEIVRDLMRGARQPSPDPDPVERIVRGAMAATAETEHVRAVAVASPMQALARLHVVAAADLVPDRAQLGRPRTGDETCEEFADLGPAPAADQVPARLAGVAQILAANEAVPALVCIAIAHAEIATIRPFTHGNGLVARAFERALVQATGLDPTGVAVTEAGQGDQGPTAYIGALTAYATGGADGVRLWLEHCGTALVAAALEGHTIADAVLAGRLT